MKRFDLSSLRQKLFGPPFLPRIITVAQLLLVLTQAANLIASQPAAYWLDARQTLPFGPLGFLIRMGPLPFAIVALLYLILIGLLLTRLRRPLALPLFGALYFLHTELLFWSTHCNWQPFFTINNPGECNVIGAFRFFIWLFITCILLLSLFPWAEKISKSFKHRAFQIAWGLSALWLIFLAAGILKAAEIQFSVWKPVVSAHSPGARSLAVVAYDTKRGRAVLYGGVSTDAMGYVTYHSDTWEWDGHDWIQMQASGGPPPRVAESMAYDEKRGVVVLYGGYFQNNPLMDVWEWDGHSWSKRCPTCNPSGRFYHQMYYDPLLEKVVVFGGVNNETSYHEAWAWDGQSWSQLGFDSQVPNFSADSLVYDTNRQRVVAFLNETWGGTWIWKGLTWTKLILNPQPPSRQYFRMAYDPGLDRTVLFGGMTGDTPLNDTWVFQNNAWSQVQSSLQPPARSTPVLFYDSVRKRIMLYGGEQFGTPLSDMWELDLP